MNAQSIENLRFLVLIWAVSFFSYMGFAFLNPSFPLALGFLGYSLVQIGLIASLSGAAIVLAGLAGNRLLNLVAWQVGLPMTIGLSAAGHLTFAAVTALVSRGLVPTEIGLVGLICARGIVAFGFALTQITVLRALSKQSSYTGYSGNTAANALGIVLGPILGGIVAGWSLLLPIYSVFGFSIFACFLCLPWLLGKRSDSTLITSNEPEERRRSLMVIPASLAFLVMVILSSMQIGLPLHIDGIQQERVGDSARVAGYALFWGGIGLVSSSIALMVAPKQSPFWTFVLASVLAALGFLNLSQIHDSTFVYVSLFIVGAGLGPTITAYTRLASDALGQDASAAIVLTQSLGLMVGPYSGVVLFYHGLLFQANAAVLLASALCLVLLRRRL